MKSFKVILTLIALLLAVEVRGQDSLGVTLVSSTFDYWMGCNSAVVFGDRIFLANGGGGLRQISLDNDQITVEARYKSVRPSFIARMNDYLVANESSRGRIVVLDPENPRRMISQVALEGLYSHQGGMQLSRFVLNENLLFTRRISPNGWQLQSLYIIDFENIENPVVADTIFLNGDISSFASSGNLLYVGVARWVNRDYEWRLEVFDIAEPTRPEMIASHLFESEIKGIAIQDTLLAVTVENLGGGDDALVLYGVADPERLEQVGVLQLNWPGRVWFDNDLIYAFEAYREFVRINIANPANPQITGRSPEYQGIQDLLILDDKLIVTVDGEWLGENILGGVIVFRPGQNNIPLITRYFSLGQIHRLVETEHFNFLVEGRMMIYEIDQRNTLFPCIRTIDFADPTSPRILRSLVTFGSYDDWSYEDVAANAEVAFYANSNNDGASIELDDGNRLREIGEFERSKAVALRDNTLFSQTDGQIQILNVADPANPEQIGQIDIANDFACKLSFLGDTLVVVLGGISFYDLTDPANPEQIGEGINSSYGNPAINDGLLYHSVAIERNMFLDILDISNLEDIHQVSRTQIEEGGNCYFYQGHLLICFKNQLQVYDVSDPNSPRLTGFYGSDEWFGDLFLRDRFAIISHLTHLSTYDISAALGEAIPPVFHDPPVELFFSETDTVRFDLFAVDLNGDSLVLTMRDQRLPELGAVFTDHGNGQGSFYWPTNYDYAGGYQPWFAVSDGQSEANCLVTIMIENVNRLPSIPRQIMPLDDSPISEDSLVMFVWSRSRDEDDDRLNYLLRIDGANDYFYYNTGSDTLHESPRSDLIYLLGDSLQPITWRVSVTDGIDTVYSDSAFTMLPPLTTSEFILQPSAFSLSAFPNPFNSSTTITFSVQQASPPVKLAVYDLSGRLVADLLDRQGRLSYGAGDHKVVWDAAGLPSAIYFVRLESKHTSLSQKVVLMR